MAEGTATDERIAAEVGVSSRTLRNWKWRPEFKVRLKELAQARWAAAGRTAIGKRMFRVKALQTQYMAAREVITARAADPAMVDVPGGKTGLVVRRVQRIDDGLSPARDVEILEVDVALLREVRETLAQAANELGHWERMAEAGLEAMPSVSPETRGANKSEQSTPLEAAGNDG